MRKSSRTPEDYQSNACDKKKESIWRGGGLADVLESSHRGVVFEAFEYDSKKNLNQKFDVIIHKLTEDVESDKPESIEKMNSIKSYMDRNPGTKIVDSFSAVRQVVSRARTVTRLQELIEYHPDCPFRQPKFAIAFSPDSIRSTIREANLSFPVICKPIEACGTPNSHSMVVALSESGLSLVSCPCVIQEYLDHDGKFCKVYVIDNEVMVFQRNSLPNLSATSEDRTTVSETENSDNLCFQNNFVIPDKSLAFDSRFKYPTLQDFFECSRLTSSVDSSSRDFSNSPLVAPSSKSKDDLYKLLEAERQNNGVDCSFQVTSNSTRIDLTPKFAKAAEIVSRGFSLSLFGFDVIIPTREANLESVNEDIVIIDINFFPSYKEIPDFPEKLIKHLRNQAGFI